MSIQVPNQSRAFWYSEASWSWIELLIMHCPLATRLRTASRTLSGVGYLIRLRWAALCSALYCLLSPACWIWSDPKKLECIFERYQVNWSPSYNTPFWDDTKNNYIDILLELFQFNHPTAFILTSCEELGALYSVLAQKNLSVPKDVSVIVIDQLNLNWFYPKTSCFKKEDENSFCIFLTCSINWFQQGI